MARFKGLAPEEIPKAGTVDSGLFNCRRKTMTEKKWIPTPADPSRLNDCDLLRLIEQLYRAIKPIREEIYRRFCSTLDHPEDSGSCLPEGD